MSHDVQGTAREQHSVSTQHLLSTAHEELGFCSRDICRTMQKQPPPSSVQEKVTGEYGVRDVMRYGLTTAKNNLHPVHPLEAAEANFAVRRETRLFQTLRDTQGLHAPLRLQMERKITSGIQRLPPLESSMVAFDTLVGTDTSLAIEDVLGDPSDVPFTFDTHAAMEKKLKINTR